QDLEAPLLRLLLQRWRGLDAAKQFRLVIQILKEKRSIRAADVEQSFGAQTGHPLAAPVIAPLTTSPVPFADNALQNSLDHLIIGNLPGCAQRRTLKKDACVNVALRTPVHRFAPPSQ